MNQRRSTWSQLESNMDLKIMQKPLFFLGFFNILRKSVEVFGNAMEVPLGMPWRGLEDAWGRLGDAWGRLGDALGGAGGAMGDAMEGHRRRQGGPSQARPTPSEAKAEKATQMGHGGGPSQENANNRKALPGSCSRKLSF